MSCATIVRSVSLPKERNHWNNETEAEIFANMEKIIENCIGIYHELLRHDNTAYFCFNASYAM